MAVAEALTYYIHTLTYYILQYKKKSAGIQNKISRSDSSLEEAKGTGKKINNL